jgi:hypothetical protein
MSMTQLQTQIQMTGAFLFKFLADLICVFFTIAWALSRLNTVGFRGSYFWTQIFFYPCEIVQKIKGIKTYSCITAPASFYVIHIFKFRHQILVQLAYEFGANIKKYESDNEVCTECINTS